MIALTPAAWVDVEQLAAHSLIVEACLAVVEYFAIPSAARVAELVAAAVVTVDLGP